ncbi:hypothetical protein CCHR01_01699 [Colletotrichum chrysophilum]|uniref:Uncharacterized protein n=1 Tax=Colletotrichum chrysophilum TaxID=1836956 RepID=A0AAD9AZR2_9PEZI|nr:hypothetical protein CCHR01_01699 [Colletotrichum chrysophilum]
MLVILQLHHAGPCHAQVTAFATLVYLSHRLVKKSSSPDGPPSSAGRRLRDDSPTQAPEPTSQRPPGRTILRAFGVAQEPQSPSRRARLKMSKAKK